MVTTADIAMAAASASFMHHRGGAGAGATAGVLPPAPLPIAVVGGGQPPAPPKSAGPSVRGLSKTKKNKKKADDQHLVGRLCLAWHELPGVLRYFISGNLGNVALFVCERLISWQLRKHQDELPASWYAARSGAVRDSISFFAGYVLHVPAQHYLHALLVYGLDSINTPARYWKTLGGMYSALGTASVGSTILNGFLLSTGMNKTVAFVATLWIFALFNYFVIGWIVAASQGSPSATKAAGEKVPRGGGGGGSSHRSQTPPPFLPFQQHAHKNSDEDLWWGDDGDFSRRIPPPPRSYPYHAHHV
jgi:hypothetical protein